MRGEVKTREREILPRLCYRCGGRYQPHSKRGKYCEECKKKEGKKE